MIERSSTLWKVMSTLWHKYVFFSVVAAACSGCLAKSCRTLCIQT